MPMKVKRGLGLLVVTVISFLVVNVTVRISDSQAGREGTADDVIAFVFLLASIAVALVMIASLIGGLVLLAWGLLRD